MTGPGALPCGTDPETLLDFAAEQIDPRPSSHEAHCAYCQATIEEYRQLWEPVRHWAARDIDVPRRFAATVMNRVRRIVQSPRHVATTSGHGTTTVTSWVLGLIASAATLATPNVARITGTPIWADRATADRYGADGVDIKEVGATDIAVTLGLTVTGPTDLPALAEAVRFNVISAIRDSTDIHTTDVDMSIDDIDLE